MEDTRKSLFLGIGAVAAAFGASLCCILPVAVAVLGVGSAALGARLEPWRPWLLGFTALFLGFAFYRAYRPEACAPGGSCAVPVGRRRNRIVLWIVAVIAVALMTFPYYAAPRAAAGEARAASVTALFRVEGMTCGGCESGVRLQIEKLDGVESAGASYDKRQARVTYDPKRVAPERIIRAIQDLGYTAELVKTGG
jgi:copper chaperone CopZ